MSTPRKILIRGLLLGLLAAVCVAGAFVSYVDWYAKTDRILPGVRVGQLDAGGLTPRDVSQRLSKGLLWRPPGPQVQEATLGVGGPTEAAGAVSTPRRLQPVIELRAAGKSWLLDRAEIGPLPDLERAVAQAQAIGREGSRLDRVRAYLAGVTQGYQVPVPVFLREDLIQRRLEAIARELTRPPVDAQYDFKADKLTPQANGLEVDMPASLEAVRRAALFDQPTVDLVVYTLSPKVRVSDLKVTGQHQIARFSTPLLSAEPGRVLNIGLAMRKINGTVLQPGETFSFNGLVGPRDALNGWAPAREIYQGEYVTGYGGGICQVTSTLYNAVLLAGLEVKERFHHDRPLEYVHAGRDATVVWPDLDFRFRNSLDVPVRVTAQILPGKPQQVEVNLYATRPLTSPISLEEAEIKYLPPPLVEVPDPTLPPKERQVVDEGYHGIEVKLYRVFGTGAQQRRELVSHDRYKPKPGKVKVGASNQKSSRRLPKTGIE